MILTNARQFDYTGFFFALAPRYNQQQAAG
jgi:hypothetical protein